MKSKIKDDLLVALTMSPSTSPKSKLNSCVALIGLIFVILILIAVASFTLSVIDEIQDSTLMAMDRDPPGGMAAWKRNRTWEILPGWSGPILIWLSLFFFVLWRASRRLVHLLFE